MSFLSTVEALSLSLFQCDCLLAGIARLIALLSLCLKLVSHMAGAPPLRGVSGLLLDLRLLLELHIPSQLILVHQVCKYQSLTRPWGENVP